MVLTADCIGISEGIMQHKFLQALLLSTEPGFIKMFTPTQIDKQKDKLREIPHPLQYKKKILLHS